MKPWLSILCPSCRPNDLINWLDSLHKNCTDPYGIELSLILEYALWNGERERWGNVIVRNVVHGELNVNELQEACYRQSTSPYIMLSGDDTICRTWGWDAKIKSELKKYDDDVVLVYPNDLIFGEQLACYPVVSRMIMDSVHWPLPYERYAIDDTIFDIVPRQRRIYRKDIIFEHLHLVKSLKVGQTGMPVWRDGEQFWYPHDVEAMQRDRTKYQNNEMVRAKIRHNLERIAGVTMSSRVMICVPTAEFARRADFYDYYNALEKPEGTIATFAHGQSPARNRNIMIRLALQNNATHCLFLDDDMAFKPDLLKRLLAHDKDVVSGLYYMRNFPHLPVMFDAAYDNGKCRFKFLRDGTKGLVEVVNIGLGVCLIKMDVFKRMLGENDPETFTWITLGEAERDHWSDDISFFNRARKMGIQMYVDTDAVCGHMITAVIWPNQDPNTGKWFTMYNTGAPEMFQIAQHIPTDEAINKSHTDEGTDIEKAV